MLWDLVGNMDTLYFNVWNTCVKLTWVTNTYFLDYLSDNYAGFTEAYFLSPARRSTSWPELWPKT